MVPHYAWETQFNPSGRGNYDQFGSALAIDGDTVLVGAYRDNEAARKAGAAYLFQPDGNGAWREVKFTASDAAQLALYGTSVAVSGDKLSVGAPHDSGLARRAGAAYIYSPDGNGDWREHKLTASDGASEDYFGSAVAASGGAILIGAPGKVTEHGDTGAAYLYRPDGNGGWHEHQFVASDAEYLDYYGRSVAIDGDNILIGTGIDEGPGSYSLAAYLYQPDGKGGWNEYKFARSDSEDGGRFGGSLAISGDNILIDALSFGRQGDAAAYLYQPDGEGGWRETKLAPPPSVAERSVRGVDISGDRLIVGVGSILDGPMDHQTVRLPGAAYLYQPDGAGEWHTETLAIADANHMESFGSAVAMSGDNVLIGAAHGTEVQPRPGKAYLYDAWNYRDDDGDCLRNGYERAAGSPPDEPVLGVVGVPGATPCNAFGLPAP